MSPQSCLEVRKLGLTAFQTEAMPRKASQGKTEVKFKICTYFCAYIFVTVLCGKGLGNFLLLTELQEGPSKQEKEGWEVRDVQGLFELFVAI